MNHFPIIGLILNTIGSFLLAFALNKTTKMLDTSITMLEHFKDTYLGSRDVLSFKGMDKHRKKALNNSKRFTTGGLILLAAGFVLQLLPLLDKK